MTAVAVAVDPTVEGLGPAPGAATKANRSYWGFVDQGVSSLTNLLPAVLLARAVDVREFGTFAAVSALAVFATGLVRSFVGEPILVRRSGSDPGVPPAVDGDDRDGAALTTALVVGAALSAIVLGAAALADGPLARALVVLAASLPAVFAQDACRYLLFTARRHRAACINDAVWLAVTLGGFAIVAGAGGGLSATIGLAVWGGGAWVGAAVGACQLHVRGPASPGATFRANRALAGHLGAQYLALSGAAQLALYLLAAVADLEALGAVRAVQLLFGPMNIVFLGAYVTFLPAARRGELRSQMMRASAALTAASGAYTLVLLVLPAGLGRLVLGDTWAGARSLVLPWGLYMVTLTLATGASVGLTILQQARTLSLVRIGSTPLALLVPVVGGAWWGARGFAFGSFAVGALALAMWWWCFRAALDREDA